MSMYKQFQTDSAREKEGVWLDYGDFRVRIARAGGANKEFQKSLERITRRYRRAIATDNLETELADDLVRQVYAKTVILDWETKVGEEFKRGIEPDDGGAELLPVTQENVLATLRALPDLFSDIQDQARSSVLWRSAIKEDLAGNS